MRSFFSVPQALRIVFAIALSLSLIQSVEAIVYPSTTPPGEVAGGTYRTYFDNMFFAPCNSGQTIRGFSSSGVPNCISGGAALSISGALGYTLYHDGMDWVSSANIYNTGMYVGIGTSTPGAKLDVNGSIRAGWNYYNVLSWNQNGTPVNGVKIKTRIPYTSGTQMPYIAIEWYDYGNGSPIGISMVWYVYSWSFMNYKASSWGNITPPITLANEGGYVTIHLGWTPYYARFTVSAYAQGMSEQSAWFRGWTVADEVSGVTNAVVVWYNNRFPGVVNFASGIWNSNGRVGIGTMTPTVPLEVVGQVKITGGIPGAGKILTSDATGLASWSSYVSGSTATGITGGVQNYVTKFGTGGNGLYASQIFDNGSNVGIGTNTGTAKLTVAWYAIINGLEIWQGRAHDTSHNIIIGKMANGFSLSGDNNIAIGAFSLFTNHTGAQNVAVGTEALYDLGFMSTSSKNNTAIWYRSGYPSAVPSSMLGDNNTFLGANTRYPTSLGYTITNATAVGYNTFLSQSNTVILGNGADVGIGTSTPGAKLEVAGQVKITGGTPGLGKALVSDATGLASWQNVAATSVTASGVLAGAGDENYVPKFGTGGNGLYASQIFDNGSVVGIGTSTGTAKLTVAGDSLINGITVWRWAGNMNYNTANGYSALWSNTTGNANTANGYSALWSNNIGDGNTANGYRALSSNTTGEANTANGIYALSNNTTGNYNTANGAWALSINATGNYNTANGNSALYFNTTGYNNTANGYNALYSNYTGYNNTANGLGALRYNSTGYNNTANGYNALYSNSTGYNNTVLWYAAGSGLTTGSWNIAIGYNTSFPSNTASNQLNIGNWIYGSGGDIGIGTSTPGAKLDVSADAKLNGLTVWRWGGNISSNTAIGAGALSINTTGNANTALWYYAGRSLTTGSNNIAIGSFANFSVSSADNNIAIGTDSLFWNNTGVQNVAVGTEALHNLGVMGSSSNNNTAIWYHAGYPVATPSSRLGNSNTFLGANTLYPASSLGPIITNATAVGANTSVRQSNTVILGNGADVGIGTSTPGAKLEVAGQVKITGGTPGAGKVLTSDASGLATWTNTVSGATATGIIGGTQNYVAKFGTGGNGLYASQIFDNGSNVGIGTGTATKKLTVDSGIGNDSGLRLARISSTSTAYTGAAMGLGVDANGNIIPISNGDVVVYDGINRATPPTPDPNVAGRQISYDFNNFFDIPTKQSFVVSDGSSASRNGPYFKENGSSALCSWNGTYGSSAYDCATADPVTGLSASPHNSFTMTAKGTTFGYQIALGARGDAPLFARSGRFNGAVGGGLYTNDSPYQTPAPWQKVLTVPANHPEYLYVNTGLNSQLQTQTGGGNVGIGTTFPNSRFEVWTGATTSPLLHFRGANNVAMGLGAMNVAVSGNANSAFGAETLYSITTGYSNAAIGYRSLRTNAGGYNNVALGQESLYSNNGGSWNSSIGYQSLYSNSSGTGNIAFGPQALYNLSTGNNNIAIGYQAARVIAGSSVSRNIAIGYQSLYSSTASDLIAIGHQALYANSSGVRNTAIGYQSLDSVTTGSGNTAVGYGVLGQTTGSNNTAYGNGAATNLTTGSNNIAIGSNVQLAVSTGSNQLNIGNWIYGSGGNIGIGVTTPTAKLDVSADAKINGVDIGKWGSSEWENTILWQGALRNNTSAGQGNTAIGFSSMSQNTTGMFNTALGTSTLGANTYGMMNVSAGYQSLRSNTAGSLNVAIGYQAMIANSTGSANVAIGSSALFWNNWESNTAIGIKSLMFNTSGVENTANGLESLYFNTTGIGNVGFGVQSLPMNTTGNYNTALGHMAGTGLTSGTNNIALGYNTAFPSSTASNQLNIGNWIYGNGGNIGIGTSSSLTAKLTVAGTVKLGTNGSTLNSIIKVANAIDVPSVAAGACTAQTTTVTNAIVGWVVSVSPASALTDRMIIAYARVSAANTVEIKFCNESAAAIDLAAMSYYISVIQ